MSCVAVYNWRFWSSIGSHELYEIAKPGIYRPPFKSPCCSRELRLYLRFSTPHWGEGVVIDMSNSPTTASPWHQHDPGFPLQLWLSGVSTGIVPAYLITISPIEVWRSFLTDSEYYVRVVCMKRKLWQLWLSWQRDACPCQYSWGLGYYFL